MKVYFDPHCGNGLQRPGEHYLSLSHCGGIKDYPSIHIKSCNKNVDGLAILEITPRQLITLAFKVYAYSLKKRINSSGHLALSKK